MKLILENWRQYLKEQQAKESLGVMVDFNEGYEISLSLIDLNKIKQQLANSNSVQDFAEKIKNKEMYDASILGYIEAQYNPMSAKAGVSGGNCSDTYSVIKSIGKGYGEMLYNALLGFAATKNIYIASDRNAVSPGAKKRWIKIDAQTDDEVPSSQDPYKGTFDDFENKSTSPADDDCKVWDVEALDKGYKDEKQLAFYNSLKDNLDSFFVKEIQSMFDEPGFFGKLFGNTPENRALKIKKQLLKLGRDKFYDWYSPSSRNRTAGNQPVGAQKPDPPFE